MDDVPSAVVDHTLNARIPLLERDDVVIGGGNSYYHDDIRYRLLAFVIRSSTEAPTPTSYRCQGHWRVSGAQQTHRIRDHHQHRQLVDEHSASRLRPG